MEQIRLKQMSLEQGLLSAPAVLFNQAMHLLNLQVKKEQDQILLKQDQKMVEFEFNQEQKRKTLGNWEETSPESDVIEKILSEHKISKKSPTVQSANIADVSDIDVVFGVEQSKGIAELKFNQKEREQGNKTLANWEETSSESDAIEKILSEHKISKKRLAVQSKNIVNVPDVDPIVAVEQKVIGLQKRWPNSYAEMHESDTKKEIADEIKIKSHQYINIQATDYQPNQPNLQNTKEAGTKDVLSKLENNYQIEKLAIPVNLDSANSTDLTKITDNKSVACDAQEKLLQGSFIAQQTNRQTESAINYKKNINKNYKEYKKITSLIPVELKTSIVQIDMSKQFDNQDLSQVSYEYPLSSSSETKIPESIPDYRDFYSVQHDLLLSQQVGFQKNNFYDKKQSQFEQFDMNNQFNGSLYRDIPDIFEMEQKFTKVLREVMFRHGLLEH